MTKEVFLLELARRLSQLPPDEVQRRQSYYAELLDDMMEDGLSEESAVARLGDLSEIVDEILKETPLPTLVKTRLRPRNGWTAAAVVAVILGAPLWIPLVFALLLSAAAVVVAIFSVIASLFICVLALAVTGVLLFIRGFSLFALGRGHAVFAIGVGLLMLGTVCLTFLAAKYASIGLFQGGCWLSRAVKGLFIVKEAE